MIQGSYGSLKIGHMGQAFMMIADTYNSLFEVLMEQVQNAIDAEASVIWLTLNHKARTVIVRDDGNGVSQEKFNQALESVLVTQKNADKLGQFGRGLVSPLGKCQEFTFTSRAVTSTRLGYNVWTFETERVQHSQEDVKIPISLRTDISDSKHPRRGVETVSWNTEVFIKKYTDDSRIARVTLDQLANGILDRFRQPMLARGIVVKIRFTDAEGMEQKENVVAAPFEGDPIEEQRFGSPQEGEAIFKLYLAPKKGNGRSGKVLVGVEGEQYRFPFSMLEKDEASRTLILREVREALTSGVFSGEILSTGCTLHASRKRFVDNDFLLNFAIALEEWYERVGKEYLLKLKEDHEDERYRTLGLQALGNLRELFSGGAFPQLNDVIHKFKLGSIGENHAPVPKKKVVGNSESLATSIQGGTGVKKVRQDDPRVTSESVEERVNHIPLLVAGSKGRRRTLVKENSTGLTFSHEEMPGSDKLWELDVNRGILSFNIRHPHWQSCESKDSWLVKLQEFVAIQALTLQSAVRGSKHDEYRVILDEIVGPFVYLMVRSPAKSKKG